VAELTAGNTGRETVVADAYLLIDVSVGEVVRALGHGTHENADRFVRAEIIDVLANPYDRCVETEGYFPAVGRQVIRDGVLDHLEKFFLGMCRFDGQAMQQLHHETGEPLERPRDSN